ncbi:MAG: hypothetical protein ACRDTA_18135 [Pseudonocardiaceae bacterium]
MPRLLLLIDTPEYKALHGAGYNILAYDIRNHGLSGQGNGGIAGIGLLEYRDVIGSPGGASKKLVCTGPGGAACLGVSSSSRNNRVFSARNCAVTARSPRVPPRVLRPSLTGDRHPQDPP